MHEIRFHGRGGQGTVVASILLAKAFFNAGYYVQTFPLFGVERRGAPVEAAQVGANPEARGGAVSAAPLRVSYARFGY